MAGWILLMFVGGTTLPIGSFKSFEACQDTLVEIKFQHAERFGYDGMPDLKCVRAKR